MASTSREKDQLSMHESETPQNLHAVLQDTPGSISSLEYAVGVITGQPTSAIAAEIKHALPALAGLAGIGGNVDQLEVAIAVLNRFGFAMEGSLLQHAPMQMRDVIPLFVRQTMAHCGPNCILLAEFGDGSTVAMLNGWAAGSVSAIPAPVDELKRCGALDLSAVPKTVVAVRRTRLVARQSPREDYLQQIEAHARTLGNRHGVVIKFVEGLNWEVILPPALADLLEFPTVRGHGIHELANAVESCVALHEESRARMSELLGGLAGPAGSR